MKDTLSLRCLVQALTELSQAQSKHDVAYKLFEDAGSYSWGYHGHSYIKAVEERATAFGERLDEYIDQRVQAVLEAKKD